MIRFAALLALMIAALAGSANAHPMLERAVPGAGAVLAVAPGEVRLSFSEPLEPAFSDLALTDRLGHSFAASAPHVDTQSMILKLKPLPPGKYHVGWHAVSIDTHRTEGGYDFVVKP